MRIPFLDFPRTERKLRITLDSGIAICRQNGKTNLLSIWRGDSGKIIFPMGLFLIKASTRSITQFLRVFPGTFSFFTAQANPYTLLFY